MPYTLKTNQISVKDPETGEYSGVDILAEQTEQGLIAELQAEGTTQVNRINQAAVDVQAAVDQAENDAAEIISDTQAAVNRLEIEKNTIAESVASMAELGTDTTFSTPGMAADAGAVGDLSRQINDETTGLGTKAPVILETTSGAIASFDDGAESMPVKKLVAQIEPVQDLHGYDNPWPGGGSKNLVDINSGISAWDHITVSNGVITSNPASGSGSTHYISYTVNGLTIGTSYYLSVNVLSNGTGDRISILLASGGTGSAQTGYGSTGFIGFTFEATDTTVVFRIRQAANNSWTASRLQLEVGTARTAFVPYSNICPISGHTGAEIEQRGYNIAPTSVPANIIAGTISTSSSKIQSASNDARVFAFRVPKNTDLCVQKLYGNTSGHTIALCDTGDIQVGTPIYDSAGLSNASTAELNTGNHEWMCVVSGNITTANALFTTTEFMVSLGRGRKTYVPARENIALPIIFTNPTTGDPVTVYGGTVTLNEDGSADVISTYCVYDILSTEWTYSSNATVWYITRASLTPRWDISGDTKDNVKQDIVCSAYKTETYNNAVHPSFAPCIAERRYNANWIAVQTGSADVRPVDCQVKMKLATPQTYHFDSVGQLKTFLGVNNVWCDTGDITELDYCADTKLFLTARDEEITGNIAPIENGTTASQAYAQGAYFWHDTKFCKALTAIASGATFTLGTNYQETTVAAELLAAQN